MPPGPDPLQAVAARLVSASTAHTLIRKFGEPGRAVKKNKVELLLKRMALARMTRIGWPRVTARRTCCTMAARLTTFCTEAGAVDSPWGKAVVVCLKRVVVCPKRVVARRRSPAPGTCRADLRVRCHKLAGAARLECFR